MDQMIFNWAVAAAGALGGWILKVIWDAIIDLKKDLNDMETKMHEDFVRRDDFKDAVKEIKEYMKLGRYMRRPMASYSALPSTSWSQSPMVIETIWLFPASRGSVKYA